MATAVSEQATWSPVSRGLLKEDSVRMWGYGAYIAFATSLAGKEKRRETDKDQGSFKLEGRYLFKMYKS